MSFRQKVSSKCPCGSGKKYKNCCKKNDEAAGGLAELAEKIVKGELPFRAEISSTDGDETSMKVLSASVDLGYGPRTLFEDEITLSIGSSSGDKVNKSLAQFTVPVNRLDNPTIRTAGNAAVKNELSAHSLPFSQSIKKLKIKSESGLFAVIRIPGCCSYS